MIAQIAPQVRRRAIRPDTAHILTSVLEGVVTNGTGRKAAVPGYRVAGKTGTAQKIDPHTGAYSSSLLIGSFVGYVPAEDPRLAIVVVIDEPKIDAWGGVVAAPVFRKIAEQSVCLSWCVATSTGQAGMGLLIAPCGITRWFTLL